MGIGLAICQTFVEAGYQVYNLDLTDFNQPLIGAEWLRCDMADPQQVRQNIERICASHSVISAFVANAGVHLSANLEQTNEDDFERLLSINIKGTFNALKALLPSMKTQNKGAVVLMSSDQALVGKRNSFAYGLTKAALASMAKTTALDYAEFGIRVNAVCPGTIDTPLYHKAIERYVQRSGADVDQVHRDEAALQPLRRLGQPQEVADLVYFLCSDKAQFITGSLQVIDGGYTAQ